MKKRWIVTSLLLVVISSAVLVGILPSSTPSPIPPAPAFGAFFYTWYGYLSDDWQPPKYVDNSYFGNYSSNNRTVIEQHLSYMTEGGIDFAIISWQGFYNDYGHFVDNATKAVFETAQKINSTLKFAIMVEPFNQTDNYDGSYAYPEIYNYVWDNYVQPYNSLYYNQSDKPLICFFNDARDTPGLTPNGTFTSDGRFTRIIVGQQNYTQWLHTDLNKYDLPQHGPIRQISVTPRYDDSRLDRQNITIKDDTLEEGIYAEELANASQLWKEGKIDIILINSWNEYPERTAIEPHNDGTAVYPYDDPFYLYNKTKSYISDIKQQAAK
jgi:hypothetical protein